MKTALTAAATVLLAYALGLLLPWWSAALAPCIVMAVMRARPLPAFLLGFLSVFLLWAAWITARSLANEHILAHRMSVMVMGNDNPWGLVALSAAIGGLMGGLGGLCGSLFIRNLPSVAGATDGAAGDGPSKSSGQMEPATATD